MNNPITVLQGYDIMKFVISLTILSLLCIPFLRLLMPCRAALQLIFTSLGILGATAWGAFGTHDVGINIFLYLAFGGMLAVLCVPSLIEKFMEGAILGGIFFLIGGAIGGFIVCPIIWAKNVFLILLAALKGIFSAGFGGISKIAFLLTLIVAGISIGDTQVNLTQVNIFTRVINIIIEKAATEPTLRPQPITPDTPTQGGTIVNEYNSTNQTTNQTVSLSIARLRGDLGQTRNHSSTIYGREIGLPSLISTAADASCMQFQLIASPSTSAQSVTWSIQSCNTGDSDVVTYLNGASIEDGNKHPLYSNATITLMKEGAPIATLYVTIQIERVQSQLLRRRPSVM